MSEHYGKQFEIARDQSRANDLHALSVGEVQTIYRGETPKPEPVQQMVADSKQARLEAMLQERGLDTSPHHAVWTDAEMVIRQACLSEVFGTTTTTPAQDVVPRQPLPTEQEARAALQVAIVDCAQCEAKALLAGEAMDRAKARTQALADQLDEYANLDADTLAHNVAQVKAGTADELPHNIAYRLAERSKVKDKLDQGTRVVQHIENEARQLTSRLALAKSMVSQAALIVMTCIVERHVEAVINLEAQAKVLRTAILSFSTGWYGTSGNPKPAQVGVRIATLIQEVPVNTSVH